MFVGVDIKVTLDVLAASIDTGKTLDTRVLGEDACEGTFATTLPDLSVLDYSAEMVDRL